ncbi:hypothetical protein [Arthrobacter oryzae]|uniref:hypothetical protein n=1 Tax=Arthrobacter oryzae TaxID=409290 RepID=UPI00277E7FCC|nr:hypothetical protein [Arthrobacter oryzae]MDQ0079491.1 hypothetical protein [Arthrobacter oryzae]
MAEVDRLIGNIVNLDGNTRSLSDVFGFSLHPTDAWTIWSTLDHQDEMRLLFCISLHLALDVMFVLCYARVFWTLLSPGSLGTSPVRVKWGHIFLWIVVGMEVAESVVIGLNGFRLSRNEGPIVDGTQFISDSKILAFIALALTTFLGRDAGLSKRARAMWTAIKTHRVSAASVGVLALAALVPLPEVWDQLPDVQRTWVWSRWYHFIFAFLASLIFAIALFVVGRKRTERSYKKYIHQESLSDSGARMALWLIAPAIAVLLAIVLSLADPELVHWPSLMWFIGIPLILVISSMILRWTHYREEGQGPAAASPLSGAELLSGRRKLKVFTGTPGDSTTVDSTGNAVPSGLARKDRERVHQVHVTWALGDFFAISVLAISGLGLIRSFVGPLAVATFPTDSSLGLSSTQENVSMLVMLVLGYLMAILAFPVGIRLISKVPTVVDESRPRLAYFVRLLNPQIVVDNVGVLKTARWATIPGLFLVVLALFPMSLSGGLGPAATFILLLAAWTIIVGSVLVYAQYWKPLEIFRLLHFNRTPVLTVLLLMLVLPTMNGGDPRLHAIQTVPSIESSNSVPGVRPELTARFGGWLESSAACDRPIENGQGLMVRPMLLNAAEGGGIRAAKWTVDVIESIGATGPCGPSATFLSSGISGGSLGLALTHVYAKKQGQLQTIGQLSDAQKAVRDLAEPEPLSAAVAGMLGSDIIASATGLKIPSWAEQVQPTWAWRDRAALMESVWQARAESLKNSFTVEVKGPAGFLVLNSTAAGLGCRVIVSQQHLRPPVAEEIQSLTQETNADKSEFQLPNCSSRDQIPVSLDFFDAYPGSCAAEMTWATAAMLSARFPYVTPAGRVPSPNLSDCNGGNDDDIQLIDGGYSEGSGLGTIADTLPLLSEMILAHNNEVLAAASSQNLLTASGSAGKRSIIVPVVLFIRNSPGSDVTAPVKNLTSEFIVPMAGLEAADLQTGAGAWLQRIGMNLNACPTSTKAASGSAAEASATLCKEAVEQIDAIVPGRVAVAAPNTVPGISPPLGWTLSQYSQIELEKGLERQMVGCKQNSRGYPCLHDVVKMLSNGAGG